MTINTAIYARTSPDCPLNANEQIERLRTIAAERDWTVVHVFSDQPTSVKKGQDRRPGELALLDAIRSGSIGKVLLWSVCRIGKTLVDLVTFMETCRSAGVAVYLDQQKLDTGMSNGLSLFDLTSMMALHLRQSRRDKILAGSICGTELVDQVRTSTDRRTEGGEGQARLGCRQGVREIARMAGISPASVSESRPRSTPRSPESDAEAGACLGEALSAMKKGTQAALSFAAGYLILRIGVAIHRHPVGSAVVLTILIIGYAIDGASAPEVVSTARSIGFIYGLVFIIGLACAGRWIAALCWFVALFLCVEIVQSWIECTAHICYYIERHWYASKIAVNGLYESSLGNYEWWTNHGRWLPSPASVCVCLLLYAVAVIVDRFFPHRQPVAKSKRNEWKHTIPIDGTSVAKSKRPPPTFENVRLVAEVLCASTPSLSRSILTSMLTLHGSSWSVSSKKATSARSVRMVGIIR